MFAAWYECTRLNCKCWGDPVIQLTKVLSRKKQTLEWFLFISYWVKCYGRTACEGKKSQYATREATTNFYRQKLIRSDSISDNFCLAIFSYRVSWVRVDVCAIFGILWQRDVSQTIYIACASKKSWVEPRLKAAVVDLKRNNNPKRFNNSHFIIVCFSQMLAQYFQPLARFTVPKGRWTARLRGD